MYCSHNAKINLFFYKPILGYFDKMSNKSHNNSGLHTLNLMQKNGINHSAFIDTILIDKTLVTV